MSITEQEIENSLRRVLRRQRSLLVSKTDWSPSSTRPCPPEDTGVRADGVSPLLGWPLVAALAPAAVSLACAMVVTVQQSEIRELKQSDSESFPGRHGASLCAGGSGG